MTFDKYSKFVDNLKTTELQVCESFPANHIKITHNSGHVTHWKIINNYISSLIINSS